MRKEKFYSIRLKMFLSYMLLILVVSVCVFWFSVRRFGQVYDNEVHSHMADISALSTTNVSNRLEQIDQLSVSVLIDRVVQSNLDAINRLGGVRGARDESRSLESYKAEISGQIRGSVFNIGGIISMRIYSLTGEEIFIGTTNREYLEYAVTPEEIYDAGGSAIWRLAGSQHYACMCRAILDVDDMQPLGYMVIVCKNEYFQKELKTFAQENSGRNYLLDGEGYIVAGDEERLIGTQFPYSLQELDCPGKSTIADPATGEASYYYLGKRLNSGWTLVSLVTASHFSEGIKRTALQIGGVLAVVLLLSFAATFLVVRQLLGPTRELLEKMSEFGQGNLGARVNLKGNDEIGQMGKAYNQMAGNVQRLMEQVYALELANREAEIEFLKMQINPHFLYNSLDTISWLGFADGNEKISDLAVSLANLLRSSIKGADMITVREEMESVKDYLNIQQYRFGDRIGVVYDVTEEAMDDEMPGFLLQPLIENSIFHGLEAQKEKGVLKIRIEKRDGWLSFGVEDDGKGMSGQQVEELMEQCRLDDTKQAIGLKNVYRRLYLLYGEASCFQIESRLGAGTRITFRIPIRK